MLMWRPTAWVVAICPTSELESTRGTRILGSTHHTQMVVAIGAQAKPDNPWMKPARKAPPTMPSVTRVIACVAPADEVMVWAGCRDLGLYAGLQCLSQTRDVFARDPFAGFGIAGFDALEDGPVIGQG